MAHPFWSFTTHFWAGAGFGTCSKPADVSLWASVDPRGRGADLLLACSARKPLAPSAWFGWAGHVTKVGRSFVGRSLVGIVFSKEAKRTAMVLWVSIAMISGLAWSYGQRILPLLK